LVAGLQPGKPSRHELYFPVSSASYNRLAHRDRILSRRPTKKPHRQRVLMGSLSRCERGFSVFVCVATSPQSVTLLREIQMRDVLAGRQA
jgi:hypothetical protein